MRNRFEVYIKWKNIENEREIYSGNMNTDSEYLEKLENAFRSGEVINFLGKRFTIIEINYSIA